MPDADTRRRHADTAAHDGITPKMTLAQALEALERNRAERRLNLKCLA